MTKLRIGFMGTPEFAVPALAALDKSAHEVVCVYTQPPRPKGRGHKVQRSPVHEYADAHGIEVFTPRSFKGEAVQAEFAAQNLDVAVVAAYGLILPKAALDAPKYGCLNIHASILPRWRGASPIQQAVWAGDEESGISIMQMDEGLDTGPVIAEQHMALTSEHTAQSLHDELCRIGGTLIMEVIERIANGEADGTDRLPSTPQDEKTATYAPMLSKQDGRVDWHNRAEEIDRRIRGLNPWPGVWTTYGGERVKILEATPQEQTEDADPGTVLDKKGHIACGDGTVLRLDKIQPAGAKAMNFTAALNGHYLSVGERFS